MSGILAKFLKFIFGHERVNWDYSDKTRVGFAARKLAKSILLIITRRPTLLLVTAVCGSPSGSLNYGAPKLRPPCLIVRNDLSVTAQRAALSVLRFIASRTASNFSSRDRRFVIYVEGAWLRTPVGVSTTMSEKRLKSSALKVKSCEIP